MISGMRVRRRSAFKPGGGYRFYRLWITEAGSGTNFVRVAEFNLVTDSNPGGVPSGGTPNASAGSGPLESAFDGDVATHWAASLTDETWLSYEFPTPQDVTMYRLQARIHVNHQPPAGWRFEASHNGLDWEILDTQSNVRPWSSGEIKEFPL